MHANFLDSRLCAARALAQSILRSEAAALESVADRLGAGFEKAVRCVHSSQGRVAVTGVGKSADIGQKIAGTLNSTGTRSYLLDATRALHGDLGMVHPDDVVLLLSHSGESEELLRLVPWLREQASALVALTGNAGSSLAQQCDHVIHYGPIQESCPLSLAPSTSATVMLVLGHALAFVLLQAREFTREDFARFHPAGNLGRQLTRVEMVMRRGSELRIAPADWTIRAVFAANHLPGRRTGAIMLTDGMDRLIGLFTDSDLARLFASHQDAALDEPIGQRMTRQPLTATPSMRLAEAVELLRGHKISELPVVDGKDRPVGLLDITDVLGRGIVAEQTNWRASA